MTDNEIIKALECHSEISYDKNACEKCPILNHCDCGGKMAQNALDLINRQKAEIKRYKNAYDQIKWERDMFEEDVQTAKAEIERLKKPTSASAIQILAEQAVNSVDRTPQFISEIKAEAIKEFAERLKAVPVRFHITHEHLDKFVPFIDDVDIDNLVKEMVGDNDAK